MNDFRHFSVGCKIRVLVTASEFMLGGKVPEVVSLTEDIKGRTFILDWQGRFSIRVLYGGKDMYFDKKDVTVVT